MAEVTAKRTLTKVVNERVKSGECLICGKEATGNRGLCQADYLKFHRALMNVPMRERASWEQEQIYEGRILAAGVARKIKSPNPFGAEAS